MRGGGGQRRNFELEDWIGVSMHKGCLNKYHMGNKYHTLLRVHGEKVGGGEVAVFESCLHLTVQYSPNIMHAQEVAQAVLAPQEHPSRRKKWKCYVFAVYPQEHSKRKKLKI